MKFKLAYGKEGLTVDIPDSVLVTVVEPTFVPPATDGMETVRQSLRAPIGSPPLREMVRPADTVGIVFNDITRPTPNHEILPPILAELASAGVARKSITLFNST